MSSATSASMRAGYTTGPSGTTGPTGKTPTPTPTATRTPTPTVTATPTPITVCCSSAKKPKLSFTILKGATAKSLKVAAKVNRKAKVAFTVRKGKRTVGSKQGTVKKRKTFRIGLSTVKIGLHRPVKLTVTGQATAGGKKSKPVKHSVTLH